MIWKSILSGKIKDIATATAKNVAIKVSSIEKLNLENTNPWSQPYSLANGSSGIALLCEYLNECFPDEKWSLAGKKQLETAVSSLTDLQSVTIGLYEGLSGISFAVSMLSQGGRYYRKLQKSLDEILLHNIIKECQRIMKQKNGLYTSEYDLISGLAGVGAYLLTRFDDDSKSALKIVLSTLIYLINEQDGFPKWCTPKAKIVGSLALSFNHSILDCGLAHGLPGILALLSLSKIHGIEVNGHANAIKQASDWLISHAVYDKWGINWPAAIPLEYYHELTVSDATLCFSQEKPTKTAWCYGAPGVLRSLWLAGKAINSTELCYISVTGIKSALLKPVKKRYMSSPTFCHGLSGLLHIANHFANEDNNFFIHNAVFELTEQILKFYKPESIFGFNNINYEYEEENLPGILEGAAGISLSLLAAATDKFPHWSRVFLLA